MVRLDAVRAVRDWSARHWPWTWGIFRRRPPVWEFQKKVRRHKRKV